MKQIFNVILICYIIMSPFDSVTATGRPLTVFVSIPPQKYFVQQIGKSLVEVHVMVPPGASPATYEPKPKQMAALSKARVYFAIGVPFERAWLKKIAATNPDMMMVHTDHGIEKRPMAVFHRESTAGHGKETQPITDEGIRDAAGVPESEHEHGILDPHIWLSPPLVIRQVRMMLNGLRKVDPVHGTTYETNYHAFLSDIKTLDAELRKTFDGKYGLPFMVFHPAWGYFAHTYGLKQIPIEIEGKDPKPAYLKELIEHARRQHIQMIFVQPQFSSKSAAQVAREIGGQVVSVDPLAFNWPKNLWEVATKFKQALK